uniref:Amelogenin n=1 Tax=Panagrolaimus superbus TaxID=310955 RepID=A0A914YJV2_9BILA
MTKIIFLFLAQYPEIECKFWSPIDATCRWCDNMNRCAPYCLQQLPQTAGAGAGAGNSSQPAPVHQQQQQNLYNPVPQQPQQNFLLPQPQLQQPQPTNSLLPQHPQPNLLLPQPQQSPLLQMPQPFNTLFGQNNLLGQPQQPLFPPPAPQPRWNL